jgi:hypothetical protein
VKRMLAQQVPKLAAAQVPAEITGAERQNLEQALEMSLLRSFQTTMLAAAGLALASAFAARLTLRGPDATGKNRR